MGGSEKSFSDRVRPFFLIVPPYLFGGVVLINTHSFNLYLGLSQIEKVLELFSAGAPPSQIRRVDHTVRVITFSGLIMSSLKISFLNISTEDSNSDDVQKSFWQYRKAMLDVLLTVATGTLLIS